MIGSGEIPKNGGWPRVVACWLGLGLAIGFPDRLLAGEGRTGGEFLNMLPGARSAALSGAYTALGRDAESTFYNPAGMVGLLNPQLGLSHLMWWEGVYYDAAWLVQPLGEERALGISAALLSVPAFNSTDDPALAPESARSLLAGAGYAMKVSRNVALGADAKIFYDTLSSTASLGAALDIGTQAFFQNEQLVTAAVVRNLGIMQKYINRQNELPIQGVIGATYHFWPDEASRLSFCGEAVVPWRGAPWVAGGLEAWLNNICALRLGAKSGADAGDWLSVGLGMHWQGIHLDYAATPMGLLGAGHRLSFTYDFGSQKHLPKPKLKVILITKQFVHLDGEPGYEIQFVPSAHVAAGLSSWEVLIVDREQKTIRNIVGKDRLPLTVIWDGLDESHQRVDIEGYYAYTFKIADRLGYTALTKGEILPVSITKLPQLKAMPRDIFAGKINFTPSSGERVKEWNIDIISQDGRVLKKYQGVGFIPKDFAWDGKDTGNLPVAVKEGFRFVIRIKDQSDNEIKSSAPLLMTDVGAKAYTKTRLALAEQVPFHFSLSTEVKISNWHLDIIDSETLKVVRNYDGKDSLPENLFWDSRDQQNHLVPNNRQYSYVLRIQDSFGNLWTQTAGIAASEIQVLAETPEGYKIKIEQILFDFNKAQLKPEMHAKLQKIAELVRLYSLEKINLFIEGHTDEVGTESYNLELSSKRAKMVMRYLVEEEGLPSSRIEIRGYGKTMPIINSNSPQTQSMNRRVEVTIKLPR